MTTIEEGKPLTKAPEIPAVLAGGVVVDATPVNISSNNINNEGILRGDGERRAAKCCESSVVYIVWSFASWIFVF